MANWTTEPQPFGPNRVPLLTGLSALDGKTPVPVAVDPATGQLQVSGGGGGGGGTQYANGTIVATPTGNVVLFQDDIAAGGNNGLHVPSYTWPLPVQIQNVNGTIPVTSQTTPQGTVSLGTLQNAATGSGNGTPLGTGTDYATLVLYVTSSPSMSGGTTVNFEIQNTSGTWIPFYGYKLGVPGSLVSATTADGVFVFDISSLLGQSAIRARISNYSAGTVTVTAFGSLLVYPTPMGSPVDAGKIIHSASGSVSSSGNNTIVVAGTNRLKVFAYCLSLVSTTAVTCIFQSGAGGTELWRVAFQTPTNVAGGANLVVQPPAWLFATDTATLLNLNLSAGVTVNYSVSYFDEA
jgi:hypothetical protein